MSKLLLLSTVISMVVFPILASRARTPKQGLKKAVIAVLAFNAIYVVAVLGLQLRLNWRMSAARAFPEFFSR